LKLLEESIRVFNILVAISAGVLILVCVLCVLIYTATHNRECNC